MPRSGLLALAPLAAACGAAAPTAAPAIGNHGAPRAGTLRDVDWQNRTYDTAAPDLTPQPRRFSGGVHDNHRGDSDDREVFRVAPPIYLDVTGDGVDDALVELVRDQSVFSAPSLVDVIVFAGDDHRQTVLGFVYLGEDCPLTGAAVGDGILEVRACEATGSLRLRWTGTALVEVP